MVGSEDETEKISNADIYHSSFNPYIQYQIQFGRILWLAANIICESWEKSGVSYSLKFRFGAKGQPIDDNDDDGDDESLFVDRSIRPIKRNFWAICKQEKTNNLK